jgi:hypothetical protein
MPYVAAFFMSLNWFLCVIKESAPSAPSYLAQGYSRHWQQYSTPFFRQQESAPQLGRLELKSAAPQPGQRDLPSVWKRGQRPQFSPQAEKSGYCLVMYSIQNLSSQSSDDF